MKIILSLFLAFLLTISSTFGQTELSTSGSKKHFVSSSAFMLVNLVPAHDNPRFFQLNFGYRITPKDAIIAEAITWQYHQPIGIPYGPSYAKVEENFPGIVRDYGIGVAYQRFHWKGLYTTIHATPFFQQYLTPEKEVIQTGFQLFLVGRVGYHFRFFKEKLFVEPSVAFTHWPINTNMPESFEVLEQKWNNYFLFEPGLHVGMEFLRGSFLATDLVRG